MRRRIFLAVAASALLVTGCQDVIEAADPPTPAEKLRDAVPDGSQGSFRYTMKELEGNAKGEVNPKEKRMTYTAVFKDDSIGFSMTMAIIVIDQDAWTKVTFDNAKDVTGLPKLPPKWLAIDTSKVDDPEDVRYTHPDPTGAVVLFDHIVDATETSQGAFTGTVDLQASAEVEVVDAAGLTALGEKAKAVPFAAAVDSSGRLTSLTLDVPGAGEQAAFRWEATFSDYGAAPEVKQPPAAQTMPAPPEAYDLLNS
ncbi:hypothetical protein [Phytohabitans houttuyneae]|uniref:Lipoprotein n=1 Tax=Phytohabitans houttuyneae TaxID=1076126 RepID=A0A6V8KBI8_9ACTN|nr:hypothetical protein [Phytohabitans houttuyneae]GFJ79336.1 hypothetical protein Phou_035160 [Phytohabitans houttuyneae]